MRRPLAMIVTGAALLLLAGGCTVMESTHVKKVQEAESLAKQLSDLQKRHKELQDENATLKTREERLKLELHNTSSERDRLKSELAYVTGARDKAIEDARELDKVLQSKSDTLSQMIGELRRKTADLDAENGRLKQQVAALEKARDEKAREAAELKGANEKLRQDLSAERKEKEEKVQTVSSTYESLLQKMKGEIAKGEVTISELKGKLTLNMVDSILFDSGKAEVKAEGREVLEKVISILKDVRDKAIRIEGHTDNVQIVGALAQKYPTNWELSAARAINVTRHLQKEGIDPGILAAVAYGDTRPVASNETPEGKAKNRRIEIILVPKD